MYPTYTPRNKKPPNQMVFDTLNLQFEWDIPIFTDIHMQEIIQRFQFVAGLIWKSSGLFCIFSLAVLNSSSLISAQGAV